MSQFACLDCQGPTRIRDSRITASGRCRRRRVCHFCGGRFTTLEIPLDQLPGPTPPPVPDHAITWAYPIP